MTADAVADEIERCRAAGIEDVKPADSADILDETMLAMLAGVLGEGRISRLLAAFRTEIERRLTLLEAAGITAAELSREAHAMVSLAGQLGFVELAALCREIEEIAARGAGLDRIRELREAASRATEAAARTTYAKAA